MIQSSLTSWLNHGFNYTASFSNSVDSVLALSTEEILSGSLWTMDGTFTLPVCHWGSEDSLSSFFNNLNSPENGGTGASARWARTSLPETGLKLIRAVFLSWCACDTDINGQEISDFVPYINEVSCICSDAGCGVDDPSI